MKKIAKKITEATEANDLVKEQAKRIAELKGENARLLQKLDEYEKRDREIIDTLAFAKKKCDEMLSESKVKYALECERLKTFHEKWIAAAKDGYLKYGIEQTDRILRDCRAELEKAFADDLGVSDYLSERERLNADPTLNYRAIISEELSSPAALPPDPPVKRRIDSLAEKDLAELLKQL